MCLARHTDTNMDDGLVCLASIAGMTAPVTGIELTGTPSHGTLVEVATLLCVLHLTCLNGMSLFPHFNSQSLSVFLARWAAVEVDDGLVLLAKRASRIYVVSS